MVQPYYPSTEYGGLQGADDDDVVEAAVRYLSSQQEIRDLVGHFPSPTEDPDELVYFIFQDNPYKMMENTQSNALVVAYGGAWATDDSTTQSVRLNIRIYVDPLRDDSNNVINPAETRRRINSIFRALDPFLHKPQGGKTQWWGGVRVSDLTRLSEVSITPEPDGNGLTVGQVFYGVSITGYRKT